MKKITLAAILLLTTTFSFGQTYPHYTMFMFNKLLYNPAYAGNKDMATINAYYRDQWAGLNGAPKTFTASFDAPIGNYMKDFRRVAVGVLVNNEKAGITNTTNMMAYYAYRIPLAHSVLSFGLQAGGSLYSAAYGDLNPGQTNDPSLTQNVKNAMLPNFGAGVYWSGKNFYAGAAAPSLLQNYYDKNNKKNDDASRQIRSYYLSGGYVFQLNDYLALEPQAMARYAGNSNYSLPVNADLNLSLIIYNRLLIGATYRTDKSIEGIVHFQVTNELSLGYAYDYTVSALQHYNNGSHEITLGYDFIRDHNKYTNPRFVKLF